MSDDHGYGTRAEHMAFCKTRALVYLPDDPNQAMASFNSDLSKHPETMGHPVGMLMMGTAMAGRLDAAECRRLIEGTN